MTKEISKQDLTAKEKEKILEICKEYDKLDTFCAGINYALGTMQKVLNRQTPSLLKKAIDETPNFASACGGIDVPKQP